MLKYRVEYLTMRPDGGKSYCVTLQPPTGHIITQIDPLNQNPEKAEEIAQKIARLLNQKEK